MLRLPCGRVSVFWGKLWLDCGPSRRWAVVFQDNWQTTFPHVKSLVRDIAPSTLSNLSNLGYIEFHCIQLLPGKKTCWSVISVPVHIWIDKGTAGNMRHGHWTQAPLSVTGPRQPVFHPFSFSLAHLDVPLYLSSWLDLYVILLSEDESTFKACLN